MLVGQRPMKSLSFVRLFVPLSLCLSCMSVPLFACPSLSFLKIFSLVFSDIVHDDS